MELAAHWELTIILVLILLNGFFSGAEIAILTARRGRLEQQARTGDRNSRLAVRLADNANVFLATVQVGITFIGTFAAAFGGASLVESIAGELQSTGSSFLANNANGVALALVSIGIAFVSLVLGELVPKRLALGNAEGFARLVARPMTVLAWAARPVVWLLDRCTGAVLFLLRRRDMPRPEVSVEDIQHMIETGTKEGLLDPSEQRAAIGALRLGDRLVREIQTPRIDMEALDIELPPDEALKAVVEAGYTRVPVYEGDLDHIVGFVYIKDVLRSQFEHRPLRLRELIRPTVFIPETATVDRLLELFRANGTQIAIVLDEYGGTEGMVTIEDVLEELVGEIRDELHGEDEQLIVARDSGSWLVDGSVSLYDLLMHLRDRLPGVEPPRGVNTVSGLVMAERGELPKVGDIVEWSGMRIEVVDMDGRRIDRLMVSLPPAVGDEAEADPGE